MMKFNLFSIILFVSFVSGITANPCADYPDGELIDNPESCDEYYSCYDGIPLPRLCEYPYKFDPIKKMCTSDYTCDSMERIIANNTFCNNTSNNVIINNPDSCDGFFFCFNNTAIYGFCPKPLLFDHNRTMCDYPENVNCQEPTPPPSTTAHPLCYDEENFAFIDNPNVCDGFYVCISGYPHNGNCPFPLFFNPKSRECDLRENVYCSNYTTTEYPSTTPGYNYCTGIPNDVMVDNPSDCEGFFLCYDETPFPGTCPYPLYFNPKISACDHRNNVLCNDNSTNVCTNLENFDLVNNPKSCSAYYLCFMGNPIHQECPPPLYFDDTKNICDYPEHVNCTSICEGVANGTLVADINDIQGFYLCIEGVAKHDRCSEGYIFNEKEQRCSFSYYTTTTDTYSTETEEPSTTTEEIETTTLSLCYGQPNNSFVSDPHDCAGWYFCQDEVSTAWGTCPDGFYFVQDAQTCDFKELVDCN